MMPPNNSAEHEDSERIDSIPEMLETQLQLSIKKVRERITRFTWKNAYQQTMYAEEATVAVGLVKTVKPEFQLTRTLQFVLRPGLQRHFPGFTDDVPISEH